MAPRASWKGYIKLSLVSCPVRLYPAVSANEKIRFNQLHKDTHNRINMKPVDPELGLVERSDLVRGYEYEDKQYIIIDDSDLDAVRIESNHTLNIEAFVDQSEVDVIYQDSPYYLAPDGAMAEETFAVIRDAMRAAGKVAIARLVMASRERVVTIGAREKGMFVTTLRDPREVRSTSSPSPASRTQSHFANEKVDAFTRRPSTGGTRKPEAPVSSASATSSARKAKVTRATEA